MSSATVPGAVSGHSDPQNDLHVELRHIRDLIFIRDLLRERGAASTELGEYDAVVDEAPTQWPKAGDLTVPPKSGKTSRTHEPRHRSYRGHERTECAVAVQRGERNEQASDRQRHRHPPPDAQVGLAQTLDRIDQA